MEEARVSLEWSGPAGQGSSSYTIFELAPCGGEKAALLSIGQSDSLASGTELRIQVEAAGAESEPGLAAEETLEDNSLVITIP